MWRDEDIKQLELGIADGELRGRVHLETGDGKRGYRADLHLLRMELPIRMPGSDADRSRPPGSEEVADAWRAWLEPCIEAFGPSRCMFESNFPVQRAWSSYQVVWNAFKRIAAGASADEKRDLFAGAAERAYRIEPLPA